MLEEMEMVTEVLEKWEKGENVCASRVCRERMLGKGSNMRGCKCEAEQESG